VLHSQALADVTARNTARVRSKARRINAALIGSHVAVVAAIVGVIAFGYRAPVEASPSLASQNVIEQGDLSVDQIAAATVAANVASTLDLSIQNNVQDLAGTLSVQAELAQTDNTFLSKPQIVEQNSGRARLTPYTSVQGDTVQSLAAKFGVSDDTIRWANNLTSDNIVAGKTLSIPGTTGVVYTVKANDELSALAEKYSADKDRIVTYNDLEITGLKPGVQIVIPDGVLPSNERPGYHAVATRYSLSRVTIFGGNTYAYGYCTWYAFNRRMELGRPVGSNWHNASTWDDYARAAGFRVDHKPEAGAVLQDNFGWSSLGHVGIVERVNADGSIYVSDMNYAGWGRISFRTVSADQVASYNYIH
jgi:surface antigen/LysM repeat protein